MTRNRHLLELERKASSLFEATFKRLLGDSTIAQDIARQLLFQVELSNHENNIADRFWVFVDSNYLDDVLVTNPSFTEDLVAFVTSYMDDSGYLSRSPVAIEVLAEEKGSDVLLVATGCNIAVSESTKVFKAVDPKNLLQELRSIDAFLIDGSRHIPLNRPTITIGRQLDNDIVLESSSVSRQHAQIRWRYGRFILHDLGSKAGTQKNKVPIQESLLTPGDVITIGQNSFIYGEGITPGPEAPRTQTSADGYTQAFDSDPQ